MQHILLTGFEPFGEYNINPSQQIAERLNGEIISGAKVSSLVLPVVFGEDSRRVLPAIEKMKPALVLSLGLAAGRSTIDVEMFAINHRRADDTDHLIAILPDAPAAYFATVDHIRIACAIARETGAPALSHGYAGSYLCNHIFYHGLHFAATGRPGPRVGFIHLPLSTEQSSETIDTSPPSLPLDLMTAAVRTAIQEALA
jgi:pyroglutamyl-peptidase